MTLSVERKSSESPELNTIQQSPDAHTSNEKTGASSAKLELVTKARQGDEEAFAELYAKERALVRNLIGTFATPGADADQLTLDVFIKAFSRLEQLNDPKRLSSWLATIARNTALEDRRRAPRREYEPFPIHVPTDSPRPDELLLQQERLQQIGELAAMLPELKRQILQCVIWGFSDQEISQLTNRTIASVRLHKYRIRRTLRQGLARAGMFQDGGGR